MGQSITEYCDIISGSKSSKRDGIRIYAAGATIKLFQDVLCYSVEDIDILIYKPQQTRWQQKNLITHLDYNHPVDRPILKKFLHCKRKLINYIIDNNG